MAMTPRLRRILWRIEDNAPRIVGFCCVSVFWALLIYTTFGR